MFYYLITIFVLFFFMLVGARPGRSRNLSDPTSMASCDLPRLETIIYTKSLTEFINIFRSNDRPDCFDWCTNACSWSPDSFNFGVVDWQPACARHDVSWRNLKRLGAFNEENKLRADNQLRDGMVELCGTHETCVREVAVYYAAVRLAQRNTTAHNHAGRSNEDCTVFPGCCLNHSDSKKCGPQPLPGQYKGDGSCAAK
jgi:hypothetical protein